MKPIPEKVYATLKEEAEAKYDTVTHFGKFEWETKKTTFMNGFVHGAAKVRDELEKEMYYLRKVMEAAFFVSNESYNSKVLEAINEYQEAMKP